MKSEKRVVEGSLVVGLRRTAARWGLCLLGALLLPGAAEAGNRNSDCGGALQRHCCLTETSNNAACDSGLVTVFGSGPGLGDGPFGCSLGTCYSSTFPSACGDRGEPACTSNQHYQACKSGLVSSGGFCRHPDDLFPSFCGHEGQRACTIFEHSSNCLSFLAEVPFPGGTCIRLDADGYPPFCGDPGERPCLITEKIPSCKGGITQQIELGGRCIPLSTGLTSLDGDGYPPFCGDDGEGACGLDLQILLGITSCKPDLVEVAGRCDTVDAQGYPDSCGDRGEPACDLIAQIALGITSCKPGLVEVGGMCDAVDPQGYPVGCGDDGEPACDLIAQIALGITSCKPGLIEAGGRCAAVDAEGYPSACGDLGEPACDIIVQVLLGITSCKPGLVEVAGRCDGIDADGYPISCGGSGEPGCDLLVQIALGITSCKPCHVEIPAIGGTCRQVGEDRYPSTCGGCNQPVCDLSTQAQIHGGPCKAGLTPEAGICKHLDVTGNPAPCANLGEPGLGTDAEATTTPAGEPIWGFADLHAHPVSNLAFGGMVIWGEPFHEEGVSFALPHCDFACKFGAVNPSGQTIRPATFPFPPGVPVHGVEGINDIFNQLRGTGLTHHVGGFPEFDGWPRYNALTHQQMYYRWLERAFRGGLKLMVAHAVNNELLCRLVNRREGFSCDDMATVDRQIAAIQDMERFIDGKHGGPGLGWFRIVRSAAEAREAIQSGRLAVVIGIEVDTLFHCGATDGCTKAEVERELARYYDMGVRHLFPIHFFDNGFGGSAVNEDVLNIGNKLVAGNFWDVIDCSSEGFEFRLSGITADPLALLAKETLEGLTGQSFDLPLYPEGAHCNRKGLTPLGGSLVKLLMGRKMIIDVDHMSVASTDATLDIAEAEDYPVVSGHSGFVEVFEDTSDLDPARIERRKLTRQVLRIRDLGGLVAPILHQGGEGEPMRSDPRLPNPCSNSSKSWARAYLYAADLMQGGPLHDAVALGSDFNGGISPAGPRFGPGACDGVAHGDQGAGVTYPFPAHDGFPGGFSRSRTGAQEFDFNTMGVAHVGLLPDFVEDLKQIGLTSENLRPLFGSAEAYVRLWEKIESESHFPPETTLTRTPEPNTAGWNRTDVSVRLEAAPDPDGWSVQGIRYSAGGAETIPETFVDGILAETRIAAEGSTTVRFGAEDVAGNLEAERSSEVRIDRTPPAVTASVQPPPNADGWNRTDVTVGFEGADALSGIESCEPPVVVSGEGSALSASGGCADRAGNASEPLVAGGIRIDRTAPVIVFAGQTPPANPNGWNHTDVELHWTCSDPLSGPVAPSASRLLQSEGADLGASAECADRAGNPASDSRGGVRIDRTPPAVSILAPIDGYAYLQNEAVASSYACTDSLSGTASCAGPAPAGTRIDTETLGGRSFEVRGEDLAGNGAARTHAYIVISLSDGLGRLMHIVQGLNLQQGIENSLDSKLQNARDALDAANAGLREDAIQKLQAFRNAVEAQRDKVLTGAQADLLESEASRIVALL